MRAVVNTATAAGTDPGGNPVTDPVGSGVGAGGAGPRRRTVVVKSSTTANYAAPGEVIDYSITVTNPRQRDVDAVDVTDPNADPGSICV